MIVNQGSDTMRILLLGGSREANDLADALAVVGTDAIYSYAGRTSEPQSTPLPTRVGGFGGVEGLRAFLRDNRIGQVIDATHPFAATMSTNAVTACAAEGVKLAALERPAWVSGPGDNWTHVSDTTAAVRALPDAPCRIFLAIGRQEVGAFGAAPQHHYLLRFVDAGEAPEVLPNADVIVARGPFRAEDDRALLQAHRIDWVVSKNAGGQGALAKLEAARALGLEVIMIDRPAIPDRLVVTDVAEMMAHLGHARLGV
jgi:precorrin-6A/cobalt-precorrin-6A reductase